MKQIEEKKYARPYNTYHHRLFKIGVNFSSKIGCLENWIIAEGCKRVAYE
ncbi:MAG: hypothetical protein HDR88_03900 [Bacteroides sp.]|nr:hypothetical protein [Bacteroides sp.]